MKIIPTIISVLLCFFVSCGRSKSQREIFNGPAIDASEKTYDLNMRVIGIYINAQKFISEERGKGKPNPQVVLQRLLEKENSWEWKNPYTGKASTVAVGPMPSGIGEISVYLMPPWKDAYQVQHPDTLWVRYKVKAGSADRVIEKYFHIE